MKNKKYKNNKDIQTGKGEGMWALFANDMVIYVANLNRIYGKAAKIIK